MNRFKNYDKEVRDLVIAFEEMQRLHQHRYFDVDQLALISDFYLETYDHAQLERVVVYAERLYPGHPEVRLRRSHLLCMQERYKEANAILLDLERLDPTNTDVQYAIGTVQSALGNPRKAIQCFLKASTDGYELGLVYGNIADEYMHLGKTDEAIAYYLRAIKANPKEERSFFNLCDTYILVHQEPQAVQYFSQYVEDHPYAYNAWYCLGVVYHSQKLYEKAIDAFEFTTTIDPTFPDAYAIKAACYFEMNDLTHVISSLREALDHVEKKGPFLSLIAKYYMEAENYVTALIYLKQAIDIDSTSGEEWMDMSTCYAMQDEYHEAMRCMDNAFIHGPNEPTIYFEAGHVYDIFGEDDNAQRHFEAGMNLSPLTDRCLTTYADFLMDRHRYDEAIDMLNKALLRCDQPIYFHLRLAECYFRTGRRNFLFNALQACVQEDRKMALDLLNTCPEMAFDLEVMSILTSNEDN
ncbi:MAG: tetratricopeptide repeat protein [Bacteroidales bacterium]|nr:tetratricopeptide repeat protein [Bacteroidales bacterium]